MVSFVLLLVALGFVYNGLKYMVDTEGGPRSLVVYLFTIVALVLLISFIRHYEKINSLIAI